MPTHHEHERPDYLADAPACPSCGAAWAYESDMRPGVTLSRIVGIYDLGRDRTVEWLCPACGARWDRGALVGDAPLPEVPEGERLTQDQDGYPGGGAT